MVLRVTVGSTPFVLFMSKVATGSQVITRLVFYRLIFGVNTSFVLSPKLLIYDVSLPFQLKRDPELRWRAWLWLNVFAWAVLMQSPVALRSEQAQTNSVPTHAASQSPPKKGNPVAKPASSRRQLSGAELYSIHCNRCHPERYPTERTAAQWKTIMLHMRVRANLPAEQARTILKYLQDNSGR